MKESKDLKIVFYDGVCGLCHGFVRFLFKIDQKGIFMVAPLQGETAKNLLPLDLRQQLKSIIVYDQGAIHEKSAAVLQIMVNLSWPWKLFVIGKILPPSLRDLLYDLVAKWRYRIFGKKDVCELPNVSEKSRLLP